MSNVINIRNGYSKKIERKYDKYDFICLFVFLSSFTFPLLESLGFPHFLFFINDFIVLFMLVILMTKKRFKHPSLLIPIGLFLSASIFSLAAGNINIILILWGMRNFYRFYIFFFFLINYLSFGCIRSIAKMVKILFTLNFFLTIIEFACGIKGDYLGGVFGWMKGVNSSTTAFVFMTYCFYLVSCFFYKKTSFFKLMVILVESLIIAALAELKFLIILLLVVTVLLALISKFSLKKFAFLISFVFAYILCLYLLSEIFASNSFNLFTNDFWINYFSNSGTSGYNGIGDLNRTGFIEKLNSLFKTPIINQIFGYGQGFAEVSSISIFQSSFAFEYADALHYNWFLSAYVYIETGYFGMFAYLSFFFGLIFFFRKRGKNVAGKFGVIISLFSILLFFYNFSLRADSSGYIIFSYLAFSLVAADHYERKEKAMTKKGKTKCLVTSY